MFVEIDDENVEIKVFKNEKGFYEYYMLVGVYDPKIMSDKILFKENTLKNEMMSQIKDQLNAVDDKEIEKEAEKTESIELERILDQFAEQTMLGEDKEYRAIVADREKFEQELVRVLPPENEIEVTTKKDIDIKDTFSLEEQADGVRTLRRVMGNIPPEFSKIGIIESDQMDEMKNEKGEEYSTNSVRYDLVLINERTGEVRPLREFVDIEQSRTYGNDPNAREDSYLVNNDGTANRNENADVHEKSIYEIAGKNIMLELGAKNYSDEVMYVNKRAHGSRDFTGIEMTGSNNFFRPNNDEKMRINGFGEGQYSSNEGIAEAKFEEKIHNNDAKDERQIDGEPDTKEQTHNTQITITEDLLDKAADIMLDNDSKTGTVYNKADLVKALENRYKERGYEVGKTYNAEELKELTEDLNDEMEEKAEGQRVPGQKETE